MKHDTNRLGLHTIHVRKAGNILQRGAMGREGVMLAESRVVSGPMLSLGSSRDVQRLQ